MATNTPPIASNTGSLAYCECIINAPQMMSKKATNAPMIKVGFFMMIRDANLHGLEDTPRSNRPARIGPPFGRRSSSHLFRLQAQMIGSGPVDFLPFGLELDFAHFHKRLRDKFSERDFVPRISLRQKNRATVLFASRAAISLALF